MGGGGGGEVPAAYNSKTICENEIKFVGLVIWCCLIGL